MKTERLGHYVSNKNERTYVCFYSDHLALSPAYPSFLHGVAEMVESGAGYGMTFWKDDECQTMYVRDITDGEPGPVVASTVFRHVAEQSYIWIEMTSVNKDHRGQRLYQFMHEYYEALAKRWGVKKLSGNVNVNNIASVKQRESVGFKTRLLVQDKIIK